MSWAIINVQPRWCRRALLLCALPFHVLILVVGGALVGWAEMAVDIARAVRNVWREP